MADQELLAEQGLPTRTRKSVPWRRDPVILARMAEVEPLHLAGVTNVAIAARLAVDEATVRRDVTRLEELWLEQTKHEQAQARASIIAKLHHAQRESLRAAAFDEAAERAVLYGTDADEQPVTVQRDAKGSAQFRGGKAAAINVYRQAVMDEAKVRGLIVDKLAPTDADGDTITLAALVALAVKPG